MRRDRRCVDDASRIEDAVRIESLLHLPEGLIQLRAEHLFVERASDQAIAVLAGEGAAEFEHEIGYLVRYRLELRDTVGGLEVYHWTDVQAANRCMRVDAGFRSVPLHQAHEPLDVI